ncbi:MAG: large conductance mechanosensitive channel protein MscL [Oscillospiraceae bacterium]|nr:large conductance mechanosensitive channel protein MscL [Oscillospiraceae bacterium]
MKNFFKEFRDFAVKGNMMDLAVGMIVGTAFTGIVKSLVDDIFMPVISIFTGKLDFTNWFIALDGKEYATLELAKEAGAATLNYGNFISGLINFIIMALVVFMIVKALNKLKKEEPKATPTTKKCDFCKSEIALDATRCPHCTSELTK